MFGFVLGMVCVAGMAMVWRRRRYARYGYAYGGCGSRGAYGHGYDGYDDGLLRRGPGRWRGGGGGRGWGPLSMLIGRLEASPDQERVIRGELEQLFDQARGMRGEAAASRDDVAKAMRGEAFDEEVMGESFARQDDKITELRKAFVGALARIHDVLDEHQRRRLATMLERGGPPWRW